MKIIEFLNKLKSRAGLYYLFYFVLLTIFFPFFRYYAAQDCFSYTSVAEKLLNGDFYNAINGVWSPLFSILLMPFLAIGIENLLAVKLLQVIIGFLTIKELISLVQAFQFEERFKDVIIVLIVFITVTYLLQTATPDLLLVVMLIKYFKLIYSSKYKFNANYGIKIGIISSLAYLSKSYALPFFIFHFTLTNIFYYFSKSSDLKKIVLRNFIFSILIFGLISGIWISLLTYKYGYVTYSTAGSFNFAIVGPEYNGIHKMRIEKLYNPPPNSNCIWEDPTALPRKTWSPFESSSNFVHLVKIVFNNLIKYIYYVFIFSPLFFVFLFFPRNYSFFGQSRVKKMIFFLFIYCAGYITLFLEQRYLIILHFFTVILSVIMIQEYLKSYTISLWIKRLILFFLFITIIVKPLFSLINHLNYGKDVYYLGKYLKNSQVVKSKVVSLTSFPMSFELYSLTTTAYITDFKFFGEINHRLSEDSLLVEMKKYEINYLFSWEERTYNPSHFQAVGKYQLEKEKLFGNSINILIEKILSVFGIKPHASDYKKKFSIYKVIY